MKSAGWSLLTFCTLVSGWPRPQESLNSAGYESGVRDSSDWTGVASILPSVPGAEAETYSYPAPDTRAFWDAYAEPVGEFMQVATLLAITLGGLSAVCDDWRERKGPPSSAWIIPELGSDLTWLAQSSQRHAGFDPVNGLIVKQHPVSLLGVIANQVMDAVAQPGSTVIRCSRCGVPFVKTSTRGNIVPGGVVKRRTKKISRKKGDRRQGSEVTTRNPLAASF